MNPNGDNVSKAQAGPSYVQFSSNTSFFNDGSTRNKSNVTANKIIRGRTGNSQKKQLSNPNGSPETILKPSKKRKILPKIGGGNGVHNDDETTSFGRVSSSSAATPGPLSFPLHSPLPLPGYLMDKTIESAVRHSAIESALSSKNSKSLAKKPNISNAFEVINLTSEKDVVKPSHVPLSFVPSNTSSELLECKEPLYNDALSAMPGRLGHSFARREEQFTTSKTSPFIETYNAESSHQTKDCNPYNNVEKHVNLDHIGNLKPDNLDRRDNCKSETPSQSNQKRRYRSHQIAEDYISLVGNIMYPNIHLSGFGYDLSSNEFPLEHPTTLGFLTHPMRRPTVIEKWSPYEIAMFEASMCIHGKKFNIVQKFVQSKTTKEIIEFYYVWKKTSHYKEWKKQHSELSWNSDDDDKKEEKNKKPAKGAKTGKDKPTTSRRAGRCRRNR